MKVTDTTTEEQLKLWDGRIRRVAARTMSKCSDPLYSIADIEQRLKVAVWQAKEKWEEDRGMSLSSWIYFLIEQASSQVVNEQYRYCRDRKDNQVPILRVGQTLEIEKYPEGEDECKVHGLQIVDPLAKEKVDEIVEQEEVQEKVREVIQKGQKRDIYDMLVSEYGSSRAIAAELGIPLSTVASVKLRAKVALALILNIPLKRATDAKNATEIARRFTALWASV